MLTSRIARAGPTENNSGLRTGFNNERNAIFFYPLNSSSSAVLLGSQETANKATAAIRPKINLFAFIFNMF